MNNFNRRNILVALALYTLVTACNSQSKDPDKGRLQDANDKMEQQAGQFDPTFQTAPKQKHIAIRVSYDSSGFRAGQSYTTRPGRIPFSKSGGGDLIVQMKDAAGRDAGKYYMQNPATQRTCDGEPNTPGVRVLSRGAFDLLLPANQSIASVEFISNGKSIGRLATPLSRMRDSTVQDNRTDTLRRPR